MSSKPAESLPEARTVRKTGACPWSIASRLVLLFTIAASLLLLCAMGALYWIVIRYIENEANHFLADKAAVLRADLREDAGPAALRDELKTNRPGDDAPYFVRVLNA